MPIVDYHCHINPAEIADDRRYTSITDVWLGGDHYKWRAMRSAGVPERLVTGDADPEDKFLAWAETVPKLIGNPLYHWTHLELQRYFGIDEPLTGRNGKAVYRALQRDPAAAGHEACAASSKRATSGSSAPPTIRRTT